MKQIASYTPLNDLQSQNYLASFLPKGRLFAKKYTSSSTLWKMLYCIADFIKQLTAQIYILFYSRDISQTVELLPEWEASVGIPSIFPRQTTIAARRLAITQLLSKIPVINTQPFALGGLSYNNGTGVVTGTIESSLIISAIQTSVIIKGATQGSLNGTFNITYLTPTTFSFTLSAGLGLTADTGRFLFNYTYDKRTTYENFVYNMSGITVHILFAEAGTNLFPMTFPIKFGVSTLSALLTFEIYVVGVSLPASTISLLNSILTWILPSMATWSYQLVAS